MITETLLAEARAHVRKWFGTRMPKHLRFHDLEHTLSVTRSALALGRWMRLSEADLALLELAALFHDTGYSLGAKGHEERGADLAEAFMRKKGVSEQHIRRVRSLIKATRPGAPVRSRLQAAMRDADSAKAGQADFEEKGDRLRGEVEHERGKRYTDREWADINLKYLRAHEFLTSQAKRRYGAQKQLNLRAAKDRLARAEDRNKEIKLPAYRYHERDISWLSFNHRVLQEAEDPHNPLLERVKFMAIYSSNLDEFYRVRVASLRSLVRLRRKERLAYAVPPEKLINRINMQATVQQERFGTLWRDAILPALARNGIRILDDERLTRLQKEQVKKQFIKRIKPLVETSAARAGNAAFIEDRKLYFACQIEGKGKPMVVVVRIPSDALGRFLALPSARGRSDLLFLDDAVRIGLSELFPGHKVATCHAFKLTRDAELYLEDEFGGDVKEKVRKSLRKRSTGLPSRLLYDARMPKAMLAALREMLGLKKADLVQGGRYHHFSDLMRLPVTGHAALRDKPWKPLPHPVIGRARDPFKGIAAQDKLLHFPYHDFGCFVQWLRQVVRDKGVRHIKMTLYRVAEGSEVCTELLEALNRGKKVTVFVEVQARFDEGSNLAWGDRLEKAGATVLYSYEGLKVHCKLCLVQRAEGGRTKNYAYLGTGNFNERTARLYADEALLTAHDGITRDVAQVFEHLQDRKKPLACRHLLVAPTSMRSALEALIDKEIEWARRGKPAGILLKLNSLKDHAIIAKLYDASRAGVPIRIIVRGICCLVPGVPGLSDRIEAISIVDRYLEHARAFVFRNGGKPAVFLSSADWMSRNLDRRIEVGFPLLDPRLGQEMIDLLELQWADNVKARVVDQTQSNTKRSIARGGRPLHSQAETYRYVRKKMN
ncbi:MAG: polyphosphate kinase 1 [Flavobacteriales bacterium]|nr:polyphosphate kinase 1 [Flavobacteriales bacterium]